MAVRRIADVPSPSRTSRALSLVASLTLAACAADPLPSTPDAAPPVDAARDASASDDVFELPRATPAGPIGVLDVSEGAATLREARRVVSAVAQRQVVTLDDGALASDSWEAVLASRAPRGVTWNYPWGVTLYGMLRASEVTGDRTWSDFVVRHDALVGRTYAWARDVETRWGREHRAEVDRLRAMAPVAGALYLGNLDNCGSMSAQIVEATLRHGAVPNAGEELLLGTVGDYIANRQSRLPDRTFWRPEQSQTLWIDDLYMSCPFLVRWAQRTGDARLLDDAARQVLNFARRQQDADGVWFHANFIGAGVRTAYKWGRANGWAMVATVEVLSALPEDHPDRAAVLDVLRRHIAGIERLQAASGRWHQVLDHGELWEETSCTAMFTYSIARAARRGWIPREHLAVAWRGLRGLAERVGADGTIRDTCEGTGIGLDLGYYAGRGRPVNDPHGPGPVLLAASEVLASATP